MRELGRSAGVLGGRPNPEQPPAPWAPQPHAACAGRLGWGPAVSRRGWTARRSAVDDETRLR